MSDNQLRVRIIGGLSVAVDQLDSLPVSATLDIYIEKQDFRDVMDINAVASELGRSVRQVRRLISTGAFPESVVSKGGKQFWLSATVMQWQKSHLEGSAAYRTAPKGRLTKWRNEQVIEKEEDKRAARLHDDTKELMIDVREMDSLLSTDPDEFARRHPVLKQWLRDKGAEKTGKTLIVRRGGYANNARENREE